MSSSLNALWVPSERAGIRTLPCGRWFDAVRVSSFNGVRTIGYLGPRTGPVIEDQVTHVLYWLLPVGSADGWDLPDVDVLGTGELLRVPPAEWNGGPAVRWLIPPPVTGNCLTDPKRVHDALAALSHGPRFTEPVKSLLRCRCGGLVVEGEEHECAEQPQETTR